jgi:arginine deiminase
VKRLYSHRSSPFLEGGDVLILDSEVIAIGISERTETMAIETLARNVFTSDTGFKHILAFKIPSKRAFMHLDTVFTMVDRATFTIHPDVEGVLVVYDITWDKELQVRQVEGRLEDVLKRYLQLEKVTLVRCGGGSAIDAQREQWNDASNTLAIAPGVAVVYGRNHVTNRLLEDAGVTLIKIPSSEISRGRGGPRCMSMPICRDPIGQ